MASKRTGLRDRVVKAATAAADTKGKGRGQAPAASGEIVSITARIPVELHERLRRHTFETRGSINAMILEGLEAMLKKKG